MSNTVIIGEGTWPTPASAPSVKITSAGTKLGLHAISISHVHDATSFDLEIKGRMPARDWPTFQRDFGQARFAAIYTTGTELAARCQFAGSSSSNGADISFTSSWKVEGKIDPGKPFQMGLCMVRPPTVVEFTVDTSDKALH